MVQRRQLRIALALALVVGGTTSIGTDADGRTPADGLSLAARQPAERGPAITDVPSAAKRDADGNARVVVKLTTDSVASYRGGVGRLAAPGRTASGAVDIASPAAREYRAYVNERLDSFASRMAAVAPGAEVTHRYDIVIGGVAMTVPAAELPAIAKDPAVEAILPDTLEQPQTDATPAFLGATTLWNQLGGQQSAGQGVVVGVIDSGIWPEHRSLSNPDPSGKPYAAPPAPPVGARACEFNTGARPGPAFTCNNKLIGAQRFMATYDGAVGLGPTEYTSARDDDGHGTHTATTAAGNGRVPAKIYGVPRGLVSGIAPRAHVMIYKVCGNAGCYGTDSAAAVQEAIKDGVRVINFSISGGANPYTDVVSLAFLDAFNAGVFVAASAGNSGPSPDTTDHREPWVTTVAASTSNRSFVAESTLTSTDGATLTVKGVSVAPSLALPAALVDAGAAPTSDPYCVSSAADTAFLGKVVICRRGGGTGRAAKGLAVLKRGAVGMILMNTAATEDVMSDNHFLPAIHVSSTVGNQVVTFLAAHPGVTAGITTGEAGPRQGDVMAGFSSRGGPNQSLGVSKPDITAPGVEILAGATPTPATMDSGPPAQLFQAIAGTSMSSPHVAGAAALLAALKPTWTPAQIKSALMTTARTNVVKEDGTTKATAFDRGSGRLNLALAGTPLFTFPETGASFVAKKDTLYTANYPSLYVPALAGSLTVSRTLKSVDTVSRTYTVGITKPADLKITVPASFTLAAGASQTINITVDAKDVPIGATRFATLTFKTGSGTTARSLVFPVTIVRRDAGPVRINKTCAPNPIRVTETTTCTITMNNTTAAPVSVSMTDPTPARARLVAGSTTGGTESGSTVNFSGTVPGSIPVGISIGTGATPGGGYLPLSTFGIPPLAGMGDETIQNFTVPAFRLGTVSYTSLGISSNGYVVLGGGSGPDNTFVNQTLPDPTAPNNVLAPFWTDLNPAAGGAVRIGTLTDGINSWIVVDWEGVREYSQARANSFQVWIRTAATAGEDVTFGYGTIQGNGDGGLLTVGAENPNGTSGGNYYVNGTGTLPVNGTQLRVTATPPVPGTRTVTFRARGNSAGPYVNYANLTSPAFLGTAVARFAGTVNP